MQNLAKAQHMLNIEWKEKPVVCVVTYDPSEACKSLSTQEPGEGKTNFIPPDLFSRFLPLDAFSILVDLQSYLTTDR